MMLAFCCWWFRRICRTRIFVSFVTAYAATIGITVYSMYHAILPYYLHDFILPHVSHADDDKHDDNSSHNVPLGASNDSYGDYHDYMYEYMMDAAKEESHEKEMKQIVRSIGVITGTGATAQMFMGLLSGLLLERFSLRTNLIMGSLLLMTSALLTHFARGVFSMCGAYATASCGQLLSFTALYAYYGEYALDQRELNQLAGCYVIFQNTGFILGYSAVSASYQFFGREATMLGLIGLMIPDILLRLCLVPNATDMIDITPPENAEFTVVGDDEYGMHEIETEFYAYTHKIKSRSGRLLSHDRLSHDRLTVPNGSVCGSSSDHDADATSRMLQSIAESPVEESEEESIKNDEKEHFNETLPFMKKWIRFLQNPYIIVFTIQVLFLHIVGATYWGTAPDYIAFDLKQDLWLMGVVISAGQTINLLSILASTVLVTNSRRRWIGLILCHAFLATACLGYSFSSDIWHAAIPDAVIRSSKDVTLTLLTTLLPYICECQNVGDGKMSYTLLGAGHFFGLIIGYFSCGELAITITFKWLYVAVGATTAVLALLCIPYAWLKLPRTVTEEMFESEEINAVNISFADLKKSNLGLAEMTSSRQLINLPPGPKSRSVSMATIHATRSRSTSVVQHATLPSSPTTPANRSRRTSSASSSISINIADWKKSNIGLAELTHTKPLVDNVSLKTRSCSTTSQLAVHNKS